MFDKYLELNANERNVSGGTTILSEQIVALQPAKQFTPHNKYRMDLPFEL